MSSYDTGGIGSTGRSDMGGEGEGIVTGDPWASDIRSRINGEDGGLVRDRCGGVGMKSKGLDVSRLQQSCGDDKGAVRHVQRRARNRALGCGQTSGNVQP